MTRLSSSEGWLLGPLRVWNFDLTWHKYSQFWTPRSTCLYDFSWAVIFAFISTSTSLPLAPHSKANKLHRSCLLWSWSQGWGRVIRILILLTMEECSQVPQFQASWHLRFFLLLWTVDSGDIEDFELCEYMYRILRRYRVAFYCILYAFLRRLSC